MSKNRWRGITRVRDLNSYVRHHGPGIDDPSIYRRVAHTLKKNGFSPNRGETDKAFCVRMKDHILQTNAEHAVLINNHNNYVKQQKKQPGALTQLETRGKHPKLTEAIPKALAAIGYFPIDIENERTNNWSRIAIWLCCEHSQILTNEEIHGFQPFPSDKDIGIRGQLIIFDLAKSATAEQLQLYHVAREHLRVLREHQRNEQYQHQLEEHLRQLEEQRQRELDEDFLHSYYWREVRMRVLIRDGRRCACCGATPGNGTRMHVDHIKPRKTHPELRLDEDNLQVLCDACNHGKGNWDHTDWRTPELELEAVEDLIYGIANTEDYNATRKQINELKMHELQACLTYVIQAIKEKTH